ncbi:unnamed protein product, partial [Thelazia callipaeda]|uniref:protein-tyrosine-phosphatase n=1 Tax=Thelazia callipaeda TaxID=103827 RepID=A0A0N5D9N8_THECL
FLNSKFFSNSDVICIDQTRIILRIGDEKSDFIHASRIPLVQIIITQLPLSNTVKQFWEMIWQENVQAILVFLTLKEWKEHGENIRLIPKKGKCLHIKGLIMLTHKNELQITSHWILQEFYLSKNNETRRILWHHYTGWEPNKPPWAHEMLHNKNTSAINIVECLKKIRTYRMHAIQSVSQYQFVYMGIQRHIFLVEVILSLLIFGISTKYYKKVELNMTKKLTLQ